MPVKIGIAGTNFISDWFVNATASLSEVKVSAVYSRTSERGCEFALRHGIAKSYTDYSEMLDSDIDAVYIASPIFKHKEQAQMAISHGKHVLCEKMMTADLESARELRDMAKAGGVVLLEAMRPAFDPLFAELRARLPEIGRIHSAHFEFCQYSSRYDRFKAGEVTNAFNPTIGNSALSDIGIYPLHMLVSLFGAPRSVESEAQLLENGFEGEGRLKLAYDEMDATVVYSKIRGSDTPSVIAGELGEIRIDKISAPTRLSVITGEKEDIIHSSGESSVIPGYNMKYEIQAFARMIRGEFDYRQYLDTTLEAIRIVDASYRQTGADRYMTEIEAYKTE